MHLQHLTKQTGHGADLSLLSTPQTERHPQPPHCVAFFEAIWPGAKFNLLS